MSATPFPHGGRLADRYRLLERVGAGGSASVHRAWDERAEEFRAVKIVSGSLVADPTLRERLLREALVLAWLQHDNVVQMYDAGEEGGRVWLVMELVRGGSMSDRVAE